MSTEPLLTRRRLIGAGAAAVILAACGDDGDTATPTSTTTSSASTTAPSAAAAATLTAADFDAVGTCSLSPETTAGPFPLDEQFDRRDITEGYPGHPLRLGLRVLDAGCTAVPGAVVEVWHSDATGDYSAFADGGGGKDEAGGTTFLRGSQTASSEGIVEFLTIYPGWYRGRAVHIHLRVRVEGSTVLTSQLFFDEAYTESVYEQDPYADFGSPDTLLADDRIASEADDGAMVTVIAAETANGSGSLALANLGV